jgi:hypothetical protein
MDAANAKASWIWEGQLRLAVKDGSFKYLFENKGLLYNGCGFEMLAALDQHCRPDKCFKYAFGSLLLLFNDVSFQEYCSRFNGLVNNLSRCKVGIPLMLLVMLFLRALHGRYFALMDQFWSRFKSLETTTIDSAVKDVEFHNSFTLCDPKDKSKSPAHIPAAASANTNKQGKVWQTLFDWLATYSEKGIKTQWAHALASVGVCPVCHKAEKLWHVPMVCPLLKELNLKLI